MTTSEPETRNSKLRQFQDASLRKIKKQPLTNLMFALAILSVSLMNLTTAIRVGEVYYADISSKSGWIAYQDHPVAYVLTLVMAIGGLWLAGGGIYLVLFKKLTPDKTSC